MNFFNYYYFFQSNLASPSYEHSGPTADCIHCGLCQCSLQISADALERPSRSALAWLPGVETVTPLCPATAAPRPHLTSAGHLTRERLTLCREPGSQGVPLAFLGPFVVSSPSSKHWQPVSALPPNDSYSSSFLQFILGDWSVVWVSCCLTQVMQFRKAALLQAGE